MIEVNASDYWNTHFRFDEEAPFALKHLGASSVHSIIINTIAPIQFLYAQRYGIQAQQDKALQLLESVPAEKNNILDVWAASGWKPNSAAQSQALIQLYNSYCTPRKCLECAIGLSIIRSVPQE